MGDRLENSESVESRKLDKRTLPRHVHSFNCTWTGAGRLSNASVCHVCDLLRSEKAFVNDMHGKSVVGGYDLNTSNMRDAYCKNNKNVPFARCTKHTNIKCACGKLIFNQLTTTEYGELY